VRSTAHNGRYILGMVAADERAFRTALKTQVFDRAYYLYGEDEFVKGEAVRELIAAASEPATREFNVDVCDAAALDAGTLGSLLGTPPMMAARRVVVVRDAPALKKDARTELDRYLAAPAADLVLVLVAGAGEKGKPDKSLAAKVTAVEFPPLSGERVARWIVHQAGVLGARITPEAAGLLQDAVGNDLPSLASELEKLASFAGGSEITESAVSAVVGVRRGETLGDLLDRVAARDAKGALAILPHVLEQPKVSGVPMVMALTTQTLAIAWGASVKGRADYFGLLRETSSALTGRPWGEATAAWQRAAGSWTPADVDHALEALLAADIALKETRGSTDEQLLTTLVLSLCAGARS
jgi:DNA polymerase-3 subunit delta